MLPSFQPEVCRRAVILCITLLLLGTVGCSNSDKVADKTDLPTPTGTTSASPNSTAAGIPTEVPFTLDNIASAIAVTNRGVYVADTGKGNDITPMGWSAGDETGRVLLLGTGQDVQKQLVSELGPPFSLAVAPDGTMYIVELSPNRIVQIADGSTAPVPLPFNTEMQPRKIALSPTGDIVLLTDMHVQILPKGAQSPQVINTLFNGDALAVDPKGAIYFTSSLDEDSVVNVIAPGETAPRLFAQLDRGVRVTAMAFDANGDRYAINETCGPDQQPEQVRPCKTYMYTLQKFDKNSTNPTDIPVQGLTLPTGIALSATDIYISNNKHVVKLAKP